MASILTQEEIDELLNIIYTYSEIYYELNNALNKLEKKKLMVVKINNEKRFFIDYNILYNLKEYVNHVKKMLNKIDKLDKHTKKEIWDLLDDLKFLLSNIKIDFMNILVSLTFDELFKLKKYIKKFKEYVYILKEIEND